MRLSPARLLPRTIRSRVVGVALLGIAVVAVVPIYDEIREHQAARERARESLLLTSRLAARAENERYAHMHDVLLFTSQYRRVTNAVPETRNELSVADCQLALVEVSAALPETTGLRLSEPDGDLICANTPPAPASLNIADRPFFRRAIDQDEFVVGDYQVGGTSGRPLQSFALPLHDESGRIIAVINSGLWLDSEDPLVVDENVPAGAEITLLDRKGLVLRSTRYAPGDQFESLGSIDSLVGPVLIESAEDGGTIHAVTRISAADQTRTLAVVSISERALLPSVLDNLMPNLAAIFALSLLTGLAIWLLIERLLGRPLKQLVDASEHIAGGDLSARVRVSDGTELQTLGERFNMMGEQLETHTAALEDALAVKDEFLGLVSHELRTPLTIVLGNARLLQARVATLDETARREAVEDIIAEAERLNRIIDNLLVLARPEQGTVEVEPLQVRRVVRTCVEGLSAHFRRAITLGDLDAEAWVLADAGYLELILTNLVSNAVKYGPPEGDIVVSVARVGEDCLIAVTDDGPGIPAEERARVFEAFYRSRSTAGGSAGIGIGLAVCARLAAALHGRLEVASPEGGGSVFTLALPAYELADDDDGADSLQGDVVEDGALAAPARTW